MRGRGDRPATLTAALLCAAVACTTAAPPSPTDRVSGPSVDPTPEPPATRLASGDPLPDTCEPGRISPRQTVAFAADGRAWSLDPRTGRLTCLFELTDPGPFLWGPQGDRVLLGGFRIAGTGPGLAFEPPAPAPSVADWGHPVGTAVVFAEAEANRPSKFFLEDRRVTELRDLPTGTYLDVAYHPSGLAIAYVLETPRGQSIWISTNDGRDPQRLVFSKGGTRFTSIAFSTDGRELSWTALHANGYVQLHTMRLADRSGFTDGWRGDGLVADGIVVAPGRPWLAVTTGAGCDERQALVLLGGAADRSALPDESRPTRALGWLDATTVLVGVGGCGGEPLELWAADPFEGGGQLLVAGVDAGASRAIAPRSPTRVPAPPEEEIPPTGVG